MRSQEFVTAYRRDMPKEELHSGEHAAVFYKSREWSHAFGQKLHDYLSDPDTPLAFEDDELEEYVQWYDEHVVAIGKFLNRDATEETLRAANEFNFHNLNRRMVLMWAPMMEKPEESEASYELMRRYLPVSQDQIAVAGLMQYLNRESQAGPKADYTYFKQEHEGKRATIEGVMNESDAAIVLLQAIRYEPGLTVVPAPAQFERDAKRTNADFIVVDRNKRAVGVQVKSRVTQRDVETYDPERIVLVDATVDFGNQKAVRTDHRESAKKIVTWSGIISAQRVQQIPATGERSYLANFGASPNQITKTKMAARKHLRGFKPNLPMAAKLIGERITRKL